MHSITHLLTHHTCVALSPDSGAASSAGISSMSWADWTKTHLQIEIEIEEEENEGVERQKERGRRGEWE